MPYVLIRKHLKPIAAVLSLVSLIVILLLYWKVREARNEIADNVENLKILRSDFNKSQEKLRNIEAGQKNWLAQIHILATQNDSLLWKLNDLNNQLLEEKKLSIKNIQTINVQEIKIGKLAEKIKELN